MTKLQLMALGAISYFNAFVCKESFQSNPNVVILLMCWFFGGIAIVTLWKLIKRLEKG